MFAGLIVALMLSMANPDTVPAAAPSADDLAAYKEANAHVGPSPEAHVKLALWCQAHGLQPEAIKHLGLVVLSNPSHAAARGLLGLVAYQGKWQRPEVVSKRVLDDEALAAVRSQYQAKRSSLKNNADSHWKLALWCEEQGLKAEAITHFTSVTRLDPTREAAWKRLGCKKQGGRWVSEATLAQEKAEIESQKRADRHWKPLLEKWRDGLAHKSKRVDSEQMLASVTDPRAVPAVWSVFGAGNNSQQRVAAQVLGQIDAPDASRALAFLAVFGRSPEVRRVATETIVRRDPRETAGLLIGLLRERIKYRVQPGGNNGPSALIVEGKKQNVQRRYVPVLPTLPIAPNDTVFVDDNGSPILFHPLTPQTMATGTSVVNVLDAEMAANRQYAAELSTLVGSVAPGLAPHLTANMNSALADQRQFAVHQLQHPTLAPNAAGILKPEILGLTAIPYETINLGALQAQAQNLAAQSQRNLANDVQSIDATNAQIADLNGRVLPVLNQLSGQDFGEDLEGWQKWLTEVSGYSFVSSQSDSEKPTVVEDIPLTSNSPLPVALNVMQGPVTLTPQHSCFGAGTLVRTLAGLSPIETIRAGDQVLTQDTRTGALSYEGVLTAFHNPPNPTLRIGFDEESIVVTGIHRFWKAGRGWTMARELKPGDSVRVLGQTVRILSVENETVRPVFNLEVTRHASYFVGKQGMLVHDNSIVLPETQPFDAASDTTPQVSQP